MMSGQNLKIPVPKIEDREYTKPMLCGPGPCDLWPSVTEALCKPTVTPMCEEFYNVLADIRAGIQYLFQTSSKLVLAMSGPGHLGMEASIVNLIEPGETLLVASRGYWDQRAIEIARRYGINTIVTEVPITETFTFDHLEAKLKEIRPAALYITHGDSSTGSVQKIEGLGQLCHKYEALLIVDVVVSIGGVPFLMDDWGVDGLFSSSQKALSGPPGISAVGFSTRAEEKINSKKHPPPFYFDIKLLALQWNCYGNTRTYHHTLSSPMLWGLRSCLQEIAKVTLPKTWARNAEATAYFHKRLQELPVGFLIPKPEDRLATVTTVMLPNGYDQNEFCKYMREKHNILIFIGRGATEGKALRIGMMGRNATIQVADAIVDAMTDTLQALKKQ